MAVLIKQEISEAQSVSVSLPLILKQSIFAALAIVVGLSLIGTQTTAPSVNEIAHAEAPQTSEPINIPPEPIEAPVEPVNAVTWQDNPNQCNTETQYIAAEAPFNCIDKPVTIQNKATVPSGSGSCHAEILKYDWNHAVATAVMMAESGGNTNALNNNPRTGDYSVGCFQINLYGANARTRPSEAQLRNASVNVAFAYKLYVSNGRSFIGQWGVCRKISCY